MELTIASGFPYHISLTGSTDLKIAFASKENLQLLSTLTEDQAEYRYSADKWSLKQIVGHMSDHERIMVYRALRFSRKDNTQLPGYEQDSFVANSCFNQLEYKHILQDFLNVREATISFINTLAAEQYKLKGFAWKFELSVEDMLRATIGHELHHMNVIREFYL